MNQLETATVERPGVDAESRRVFPERWGPIPGDPGRVEAWARSWCEREQRSKRGREWVRRQRELLDARYSPGEL